MARLTDTEAQAVCPHDHATCDSCGEGLTGLLETRTAARQPAADTLREALLEVYDLAENRPDIRAVVHAALAPAALARDRVSAAPPIDYIFDLPIGMDVTYSRGYSAGIAAAREGFREAIAAIYAETRKPGVGE